MANPKQLQDVVDDINRSGGLYHQLDLGADLVIKGEYDMTRYIDFYGIPADLSGRTVLISVRPRVFSPLSAPAEGPL